MTAVNTAAANTNIFVHFLSIQTQTVQSA